MNNTNNTKIVEPQNADFEKANDDYLREALQRTYTERFLYATMLYKVQKTMEKAKIVHKKMDK